jgi:hypothetical protein
MMKRSVAEHVDSAAGRAGCGAPRHAADPGGDDGRSGCPREPLSDDADRVRATARRDSVSSRDVKTSVRVHEGSLAGHVRSSVDAGFRVSRSGVPTGRRVPLFETIGALCDGADAAARCWLDPFLRVRIPKRRRYGPDTSAILPVRREQVFDTAADLAGPRPHQAHTFGTGNRTFGTATKAPANHALL